MREWILKGIRHGITMFAKWLAERDSDEVGFDDAFTNNLSPMEYFQHNISLIAASSVPLKQKIEQARHLMDDIKMEEKDRAAWLDAL